MTEMPGVPDSGETGLRATNTWLWELLAERDARIAEQAAEIALLREALAGLQSQGADLAAPAIDALTSAIQGQPWLPETG